MIIKMTLNNATVFEGTLSPSAFLAALHDSIVAETEDTKSAAITVEQARELIGRVHVKTVALVKRITELGGVIRWKEMRKILGINDVEDWKAFSGSYCKGAHNSLRNITGNKQDILFHWNNSEPEWADVGEMDKGRVYIDGKALKSLTNALTSH